MNTFAERLKYAMEQADLKQSALSEQAGISKAAISQYLSGKNTPNQERIKALADVTGVTFDFLMGYGAAPVTDAPPPVKKISVKEAARCMGKSDQFVRIGLQRGLLPFGNAVPGTGNNWNYYISASLPWIVNLFAVHSVPLSCAAGRRCGIFLQYDQSHHLSAPTPNTGSKCFAPVPACWQRRQPPARPGYVGRSQKP